MNTQEAAKHVVMLDGHPTLPLNGLEYPRWKNTFNAGHRTWGYISFAMEFAQKAMYPYFTWNGRVYHSANGYSTGVLETEL